MILYTPLCQEDIFPVDHEYFSTHQYISYQGKVLFVEEIEKGSYELLQLVSTDPQDYLNKDFAPGTILM